MLHIGFTCTYEKWGDLSPEQQQEEQEAADRFWRRLQQEAIPLDLMDDEAE